VCGICGSLELDARPVDGAAVGAMLRAMVHRGPDSGGQFEAPGLTAGIRRLAVIDPAGGTQPIANEDGTIEVVFNGEIYNFALLRAELEREGFEFHSDSDTEVILNGYRAWGRGILDRLSGMFAFALHDSKTRETLLARDPLGIKPLYTLDDGRRLLFASEVQALHKVAGGGDIDPEALAVYLQWGSIAPPRTFYSRIRALPSGCWQLIREGSVGEPKAYFQISDCLGRSEEMDEHEAKTAARDALRQSARSHLVSDVPVGVFLSGGVDSAALLGLMSETGGASLRTFTLAFDDPNLDERDLAKLSARTYGSDHTEIVMQVDEIGDRMPDAVRSLDQPTVNAVNSYFVAEAAAQAGLKVAVSGVGGDELFGGYGSFSRIPRIRSAYDKLARVPLLSPRLLARAVDATPRSRWRSRASLALDYGGTSAGAYVAERMINTQAEVRRIMAPEFADAVSACPPVKELEDRVRADSLPEEERISALELRQYLEIQLLRDIDAVSMRHSLEVRTPLVDRDLLCALGKIPARFRLAGPAKQMLREAPRPVVPDAIWDRPKRGFTLPFDSWLRSGRIPLEFPEHPLLSGDALRKIKAGFESGSLHFSRVWQLMILRDFLT